MNTFFRSRLLVGIIFLFTDLISHELSQFFNPSSNIYWEYYVCATFIDCFLVMMLSKLDDEVWMADLMIINSLAVVAHLYGGLIWWAYWPPNTYNYAVEALSAAQWIRLFMVNKNDKTPMRGSGVYKYVYRMRSINFSMLSLHKK